MADTDNPTDNGLWGRGSIKQKIRQWESQEDVKKPPKSQPSEPQPQKTPVKQPQTNKQTVVITKTIPRVTETKQITTENSRTKETKVEIKRTTQIIQQTQTKAAPPKVETRTTTKTKTPVRVVEVKEKEREKSAVKYPASTQPVVTAKAEPLQAPELVASIMGRRKGDRTRDEVTEGQDQGEPTDISESGVPDTDNDVHLEPPEREYVILKEDLIFGMDPSESWQVVGTKSDVDDEFDADSSNESGQASRRATLGSDDEMEVADDNPEQEGDDGSTPALEEDAGEEAEEMEVDDDDADEDVDNEEETFVDAEDGGEEENDDVEESASQTDEYHSMTSTSAHVQPPVPAAREYKKTVDSAVQRDSYSAKLAALLYLRGINAKQEFRLATSVAGAGLFADVVLKYKSDDDWKTCFIQVRHKDSIFLTPDVLTNATGAFCLDDAYISFCDIRAKTSSSSVDEIFNGSFSDTDFVIYSNAVASEKLSLRLRPGGGDHVDKLLGCGLNDETVIKLNEESDKDIFQAHPEKRDFLKKLKLLVGQPSEIDLDHLIKMELRSACTKYLSNVHIIYRFFIEAVQQWWTEDETFLTQKVNLLDKAESILNVYNLTARQKQLYKLPDVNFTPDATAVWNEEFHRTKPLCCIQTTSMTAKFSSTKLMQCLWEVDVEYIFTSLEALLNQADEVVDEWSSGEKDYLVIVSEAHDDHDNLCDNLHRVFKKKPHKQLIVLSSPYDPFTANLQSKYGEDYEELFDPYDLQQLDKESTEQILEREVRFQGCPIYLRCIIGDDLDRTKSVLSANNFDTILNNGSLDVGSAVVENEERFIGRTIERRDVVDRRILTADDFWGIIAVSNIAVEELKSLAPNSKKVGRVDEPNSKDFRYLALDSLCPEEEYNQLCESRKDVHWFHMKNDELVWRRSQRNLTSIARYIGDTVSIHVPENVLDLDDRVILVVADPKSGRSLLTSALAYQTKQADPSLWVIQVRLDRVTALFENANSEEFNVVDFLAHVCLNPESNELERDLLRFGVEERGNVAVFIDGLDAIVPRYLRASLALLSRLLRTKISKIFITAQTSLKDMLESHLATFAYRMCPVENVRELTDETDA